MACHWSPALVTASAVRSCWVKLACPLALAGGPPKQGLGPAVASDARRFAARGARVQALLQTASVLAAVGRGLWKRLRPVSRWSGQSSRRAVVTAAVASDAQSDPLAIFVVLRKDLDWPIGAMINQACHACTAVAWEARDDELAVTYLTQAEGQMVKSTLAASNQAELEAAAQKLREAGIPFKLWVEHPEEVPVCIATWPRRRSELRKALKKFQRY
ncbi:unnamed protein product [Polarella glacialis]|uniref:peptidyl-tRNA hydrolase n=1 Tax=Polarella glacialis TaxID=89957 RepID=A0A813LJZ6_POLGL|nr:unnamed protein product [Polarella glacialis]